MHRGRGKFSGGHPKGLRGRDIGMYYRQKSLEKTKNKDIHIGPNITLPKKTIGEVESLLSRTGTDDCTHSTQFEKQFAETLNTTFDQFLDSKKADMLTESSDTTANFMLLQNTLETEDKQKYKDILAKRTKLPAYEKMEEILHAVSSNQVILISGDTGCGKTTQVPQYILDSFIKHLKGAKCNIICTQPRRISAITVAERVAWERTEKLGISVGYQIRLQGARPRSQGSITYCTTGIVLRQMESDPLLKNISHLFIDEVHERAEETDILLALLKKIIQYRSDLKVILMSATFNTEAFSKYFNSCPIIYIHGTMFPVEAKYLEDVLQETKFNNFPVERRTPKWHKHTRRRKEDNNNEFENYILPYVRSVCDKYSQTVINCLQNPTSEQISVDLVTTLIFHISRTKPDGAILVFLPGYDTISKVYEDVTRCTSFQPNKFKIYPLHSMMPTVDQRGVFDRPPPGIRKVILATNIAETSITIDDIVYVINAGKIKMNDYNLERNLQTLEAKWVTLANSMQRRGRAGRVQPGTCYHLYTRGREKLLDQFPTPEILRMNLASVILNLKMLRIHNVKAFFLTLIDSPHEMAIENSINLLKRINALDDNESLTPLGLHLARLPVEPQAGKLLLMASLFRCIDPISSVAASLAFKDPFHRPLGKEQQVDETRKKFAGDTRSDHLMLATTIEELRYARELQMEKNFCYENFLSLLTLKQLERMKAQFCELLESSRFLEHADPQHESSNINSTNQQVLRAIICAGLYPNVAYIRQIKLTRKRVNPVLNVITPEDGRVELHPSSVNAKQNSFDSKYMVYYMKQKSSSVYLFDTTMIHPMALLIFGDGVTTGLTDFGKQFICVSNEFRFESDSPTINLVYKLRHGIDVLLQKKALHPSPIDMQSHDANVIKAIIHVLNKECPLEDFDDSEND